MLHRDSSSSTDFIERDGCYEQLSTMLKVFVTGARSVFARVGLHHPPALSHPFGRRPLACPGRPESSFMVMAGGGR
jgi:hypothetical protein